MSRRRSLEPLTKITLNLYTQDVERMKELYPDAGYTVAIKMLVRKHLLELGQQEAALIDTVGEIDIDI